MTTWVKAGETEWKKAVLGLYGTEGAVRCEASGQAQTIPFDLDK
jgi:hypothetical protein